MVSSVFGHSYGDSCDGFDSVLGNWAARWRSWKHTSAVLSVTENADPLVEEHSGELSENYSDWNAADVEFWVRAALAISV